MIRVDVSQKRFGGKMILADVHCTIREGETVALLGPSGIGKTTLLRIVAGLDPDFVGKIERPERLAMVFQEPLLLPWRSALRNLTLATGIADGAAAALLSEVGLADKAEDFPGQLSLGQQRRLALARAFAAQPEFLLMDEPFASLDQSKTEEMIALTKTLIAARGVTTLFVTHSEHEAALLADRKLHLDGRPAQFAET